MSDAAVGREPIGHADSGQLPVGCRCTICHTTNKDFPYVKRGGKWYCAFCALDAPDDNREGR